VPSGVKVDRRNPTDGKMMHFISVSEDGVVNIWDSRPVDKDIVKNNPDYIWKPYI